MGDLVLKAPQKGMSNREYMSILRAISKSKGSVTSRVHRMAKVKYAPIEMNKHVIFVQYDFNTLEYRRLLGDRPGRPERLSIKSFSEDIFEFANKIIGNYFADLSNR
jgi:hypothetical protein